MEKRKVISLKTKINTIHSNLLNILGRGRPQGSVKKPKQPKVVKEKVKVAAKKAKEPKPKAEAKNGAKSKTD